MSDFGVVTPPDKGDANERPSLGPNLSGWRIPEDSTYDETPNAPETPHPAPGTSESRREALGRRVREVWVAWASEQPDPKPHWLTGWDDLDTGQREVDVRIGGALWGDGFQDGLDSLDYARARGAALRAASEMPQAPRPAPGTPQRDTGVLVAALSRWIDEHPPNAARGRTEALCLRVGKVQAEAGEAWDALSAVVGENPRKGVHGTEHELLEELLDVAITALGAWEHITGNNGWCMTALADKVARVADRAGVTT